MNIATVLIVLVLAALLGLAVRYLVKHGMCAACENRAVCRADGQKKGAGASQGCAGSCAACPYHEYERNMVQPKHSAGM